jgi:hypothetical protein
MHARKRRWQKQNTGFPYSHLRSPTSLNILPDKEMSSHDEIFSDESSFYGKLSPWQPDKKTPS